MTNAKSTGELQALTVDALRKLEANGTAKLLKLGDGGSGSGVISAYPPPDPSSPSVQSGVSHMSGNVAAPVQPGALPPTVQVPRAAPPSSAGRVLSVILAGAVLAAATPSLAENAQQERMKSCNAQAGDKKGDERKKFMSECLKGAPKELEGMKRQ